MRRLLRRRRRPPVDGQLSPLVLAEKLLVGGMAGPRPPGLGIGLEPNGYTLAPGVDPAQAIAAGIAAPAAHRITADFNADGYVIRARIDHAPGPWSDVPGVWRPTASPGDGASP